MGEREKGTKGIADALFICSEREKAKKFQTELVASEILMKSLIADDVILTCNSFNYVLMFSTVITFDASEKLKALWMWKDNYVIPLIANYSLFSHIGAIFAIKRT